MQDNVIPCPHCGGTGELRIEWWVEYRYQDCSDWYGPFPTEADAKARAEEGMRLDPQGVNIRVVRQISTTEEPERTGQSAAVVQGARPSPRRRAGGNG